MTSAAPLATPSPTSAWLDVRDPERAAAAHLLRRTAMSVSSNRVDELAGLGHDDAVSRILEDRGPDGRDDDRAPASDDTTDTISWWVDRMCHPDTGLTDRMAWFWHGLLTSSRHKASDSSLVAEQLDHLRANGRGEFRELLQGFVTTGALLDYLDGSGSTAARPNENLARELMELFTIGRGNYDENDVRAAARALAGWVVEDGEVEFRRENAFIAPLIFLGEQDDWDTGAVVDRLCDHPATAVRVAGRLWTDLTGSAPAAAAAVELGAWWQDRDLAIEPLLERILGDQAFIDGRRTRARTGLEWFCAARAAVGLGAEPIGGDLWRLEQLGQLPYDPPNVGGWPRDDRWLSAGSLLARAGIVQDLDAETIPAGIDTADQILDACAIHEVSATTFDAIEAVGRGPVAADNDPVSIRLVRWRLALTSPEFHLS